MLQLDGLRIVQGEFRLAADWTVPSGARVAVLGPSGGGKSTLLAVIAGFLRPTSGRVLWQGEDLGPRGPGDRPIDVLFQDNNLFPHLTVGQNLGLALSPALRLTGADRDRIAEALDHVGLGGLEHRHPAGLSGGQQSRAALARVLLRRRPVLLLDEPFAALGPALRVEMLALVRRIVDASGQTLLMVTHEPADALRLEGLAVFVADGVAAAPVDAAALLADPPQGLRAYLGPGLLSP
jgi:thiamine transport system ATP-binding protein